MSLFGRGSKSENRDGISCVVASDGEVVGAAAWTHADVVDENAYYRQYPDGSLRCRPGNERRPVRCDWHPDHHWCKTCEGWYGVPHELIHTGSNKHPNYSSVRSGCVCRPCIHERHEREAAT